MSKPIVRKVSDEQIKTRLLNDKLIIRIKTTNLIVPGKSYLTKIERAVAPCVGTPPEGQQR